MPAFPQTSQVSQGILGGVWPTDGKTHCWVETRLGEDTALKITNAANKFLCVPQTINTRIK